MLQFRTQLENCQLVHVDREPEGNPLIQLTVVESLSSLRQQQKSIIYNSITGKVLH